MKRLHGLVVMLALVMSGCSKPIPMGTLERDATILAFGDSLTVGKGASEGRDYPSVLSNISNYSVINVSKNGRTTREGLELLPEALVNVEPELVIIGLSGNDFLRAYKRSETKENMRQMIQMAKLAGAQVVLLGVQSGWLSTDSDDLFYELSQEESVNCICDALPNLLGDDDMRSDQIHLNDIGYTKLAQDIYDYLKRAGALR